MTKSIGELQVEKLRLLEEVKRLELEREVEELRRKTKHRGFLAKGLVKIAKGIDEGVGKIGDSLSEEPKKKERKK